MTDCRAWFSDQGYAYWESPQTHTGRVNCYSERGRTGPTSATRSGRATVVPAMAECYIDSFNYRPLSFKGRSITLTRASWRPGIRIRRVSGSYFFISLTAFKT